MIFDVRQLEPGDAAGVVQLFSEGGNPHNWTLQKWRHFYEDYPEGKTVSFVAIMDDKIIGHYGLFPVVIGGHRVYMGAHAHISESVRGLAVISSLMKSLDSFCIANDIPFIVGFANPRFTTVKNKLFKWKTPLWASFVSVDKFDPTEFKDRPLTFEVSPHWIRWRFGVENGPIVSRYRKPGGNTTSYQLLYTNDEAVAANFSLDRMQCWSPVGYRTEETGEFAQPFSVKCYNPNWNGPDVLDPDNWLVQMGFSDTFVYEPL
jgi:hypothetical protein